MNVYSDPISKAAHDALSDQIALDIQRSRNFATSKPDIGQTERDHILWLCMLLERVLLQSAHAKVCANETQLVADMFWDDDDPEMAEGSINDVMVAKIESGRLSDGDMFTVQMACRLPNQTFRAIATGDGDYSYEPVDKTEVTYLHGQGQREFDRWLADRAKRAYAEINPLGGPAKVFEAAASRIRAGENLADVMDDYGLAWTTEDKRGDK